MRSTNLRGSLAILLPLAALSAPLLSACGSSGGTGTGAVGNVVIKDANNYTSTSVLTIPTIQTAPAVDLTFTWDGITDDLLCHPATSIDSVTFVKFPNKTQAALEKELAVGQFNSDEESEYGEFLTANPDGGPLTTTAMLSQMKAGAAVNPATDYLESSTTLYLMLFAHGTALGVGAEAMTFIQPTSSSTNTTVVAPDACSSQVLDFTPTLSTVPLSIPVSGPWKIDWSQITRDNFGNPINFSVTMLNKVEVGFFQDKQPSDIQSDFLNVEQDATSLYTYSVPVGQKYVDLMSTPTTGGPFPGFAGTAGTSGTWAVAVLCSTCSVPAPVVFSILQPQ